MENEMKELVEGRMNKLRKESGTVVYTDALTSFFYELIRDHLPAGAVEELVYKCALGPQEITFTNGWLAKYANNLAKSIINATDNRLKTDLSKAFIETDEENRFLETQRLLEEVLKKKGKELEEKEKELDEKEKWLKGISGKGFDERIKLNDGELSKLEKKLIQDTEDGKVTKVDKCMNPSNTTEKAKDMVNKLVAEGYITKSQAKDLKCDIDGVIEMDDPEEIKKEHSESKTVSKEDVDMVEQAIKVSNSIGKIDYKKLTPMSPVEEKDDNNTTKELLDITFHKSIGKENDPIERADVNKIKPITIIPLTNVNDKSNIDIEKVMLDSDDRIERIEKELKKYGLSTDDNTDGNIHGYISKEDMEKWKNTTEELRKITIEEDKSSRHVGNFATEEARKGIVNQTVSRMNRQEWRKEDKK